MLLAYVDGAIARATPSGRGVCPGCDAEVIAKCGTVVIHHWSHRADFVCDVYTEGESEWHRAWKLEAMRLGCAIEVTFREQKEWHRADIVRKDGVIIELQHSPIDLREFAARVAFYRKHGGLAWVFDAADRWEDVLDGVWTRAPGWLHALSRCPLFLDFGDGLLRRVISTDEEYGRASWSGAWRVETEPVTVEDILLSSIEAPVIPASGSTVSRWTKYRAECITTTPFTSRAGKQLLRWSFRVWPSDGGRSIKASGITGDEWGSRDKRWTKAVYESGLDPGCMVTLDQDETWGWQVRDVFRAPDDLVTWAIDIFGEDIKSIGPRVFAP